MLNCGLFIYSKGLIMENWTEIKITVNSKDVDKATDIANMTVDYGVYIEDYTDLEEMAWSISRIDLIDEELVNKDRNQAIIHIYIPDSDNPFEAVAYLTERFTAENINNTIICDSVKDTNWLDGWKKYFKPIEIGTNLVVCPSWEKYDNTQNRKVLNIDPGAAFGTGTHETTNLCLNVLDKTDCKDKKVLDIGCGSGILALSSLLLGAKSALGVDIDELAVKTAVENAKINNLSDKSEFVCGDLVDKVSGTFDIICANIVADVIITLCDNVSNYMNENSVLILSGIIDSREQDVINKINKSDIIIEDKFYKNNWVSFVCKKVNE